MNTLHACWKAARVNFPSGSSSSSSLVCMFRIKPSIKQCQSNWSMANFFEDGFLVTRYWRKIWLRMEVLYTKSCPRLNFLQREYVLDEKFTCNWENTQNRRMGRRKGPFCAPLFELEQKYRWKKNMPMSNLQNWCFFTQNDKITKCLFFTRECSRILQSFRHRN